MGLIAVDALERMSVRELEQTYAREVLSPAILQGLRDAAFTRFDVGFRLAAELAEPARGEEAFEWIERYLRAGAGVADVVAGWDYHVGLWLHKLAELDAVTLRRRAQQWEGALGEQAHFCLALSGHEAYAPETLEKLAKVYLNAAPGRFPYERRVPLEALSAASLALLERESYPILQAARVQALCDLGADAAFRVALVANYCGQDFRANAFCCFAPVERQAARFAAQRILAEPALSFEGQIALGLFLASSLGERATEERALWEAIRGALELDLRSGSVVDLQESARALRALPDMLREPLLENALTEARSTALVPILADVRLLSRWLERVDAGEIDVNLAREILFRSQDALPALIEQLRQRPKHSAALVGALAEALGEAGGPGAAELLVAWLHHPSRGAVTAAVRGLERMGPSAEPVLQAAIEAPRRQVRDAAERLLERFQRQRAAKPTPLARVDHEAQRLGEAERDAFLQRCERWAQRSELWSVELKPQVRRYGAVALWWLRGWFAEHVQRGEARLWCEIVEWLAEDPIAVWVAVESFAGMPKLGSHLWSRPRRALARCGDLVNGPITDILARGTTEYKEALYGLLARQPTPEAVALLVSGLREPSKAIRAHCVDGLSRFSSVPIAPLLELLHSSALGTRTAVAELLAVWAQSEATEDIQRALNINKSVRLEPYLQEALVSCGGIERLIGASPQDERWTDAVISFLATQRAQPPRFARIPPLPRLRSREGRVLDEASQDGFLACVMRLDATLKGRLVRALKPAFEQASLLQWCREVYERWSRSKDPRHKWAVLQVWLFADDALIGQLGQALGELRSTEHAAMACYLRALQWHDSQIAVDWLVHWSSALPSRGMRAIAEQSLGRVAFKRGVKVSQLRARANHWLAVSAFERGLVHEGRPRRERLHRHWEQGWLTGRCFTFDWLRELLPDYEEMLLGSLWRDASGNELLWSRQGLLDEEGQLVELSQEAELRLVHPVRLTPRRLAFWRERAGAWSVRISEMLTRPIFISGGEPDLRLSEIRTDSSRLERWLRRYGWFHGEPLEQGMVYENCCILLQRTLLVRLIHTGYAIGARDVEPIDLLHLEFKTLEGQIIDGEDLEPEVYSEICHTVSRLNDGHEL